MTAEPRETCTNAADLSGIRNILVPPGIVPVQRRSPLPVRKRTPWHPRPDGDPTLRSGGREWFGDRIFVDEAEQGHKRAGYGMSVALHVSCTVVLVVGLMTQSNRMPYVQAASTLVMPAFAWTVPVADARLTASRSVEQSAPQPPPAAPPPAAGVNEIAPVETPPEAAPVEAPTGIEPETGTDNGVAGGVVGGLEGGTPGGIVGGVVEGAPSPGPSSPGPLRIGNSGIAPPRKIKDVKPVYPPGALTDQAQGTVIIEAVIGTDGKVQQAKVLRSVPRLDQAALDAVRQWEYTVSMLNGVPVSVIMTIIISFAIQ